MDAPKFIAHRILRALRDASLPVPGWATSIGETSAPGDRIELDAIHGLWAHAMHHGAPPSFPVEAALVPLAEMQSALTFLCASSATLGEAVMHMVESWNVVSGLSRWRFEADGGAVRLVLEGPPPASIGERCHIEYLVADLVHTARIAIDHDQLALAVSFRHGAPGSALELGAHGAVFGEGLRWECDEVSIAAPAHLLSVPMKTAAPGLAAVLEQQVDAMRTRTSAAPTSDTLRVRDALRAALGRGALPGPDVRLEMIAKALGLGARTLLRRLRAEGTSYQAVLDDVRRELARDLLASRGKSSKEVSTALGFSDPRAFARAFRRWTGHSPGSFRVSSRVPSLSLSDA